MKDTDGATEPGADWHTELEETHPLWWSAAAAHED